MTFRPYRRSDSSSELHLNPDQAGVFAEADPGSFDPGASTTNSSSDPSHASNVSVCGSDRDQRPADFADLVRDDDDFYDDHNFKINNNGLHFRELTPPQPVAFWPGVRRESQIWGPRRAHDIGTARSSRDSPVSPLTPDPTHHRNHHHHRPVQHSPQRPQLTLTVPHIKGYRAPSPVTVLPPPPPIPPKNSARYNEDIRRLPSHCDMSRASHGPSDRQTVVSQALTSWPDAGMFDGASISSGHESNAADIRFMNNARLHREIFTAPEKKQQQQQRHSWRQAIIRIFSSNSRDRIQNARDEESQHVFSYFDAHNDTLVAQNAHLLKDGSWRFTVVEGRNAQRKPELVPRFVRSSFLSANGYRLFTCVLGFAFLVSFIVLVAHTANPSK